MNDLKKYAGLLNDIAPKNHLLAYITPSERDMLVEAGGVKTPTPSGIFAYPPSNDARGQSTGSSSSSNSSGGGGDTSPGATGGEGGESGGTTTSSFSGGGDGDGGNDIDSNYNASDAYFTPTQPEPTFVENVTNFVKGGGLMGLGIRTAQDIFGTPENKYEGITGEDGYGEGDYISTVGDWAESRDLTTDYSSEDLETQQVIDQKAFDAGFRSESFNDLYQTGNTQNIQNLNQPESNLVQQLISQAPFSISGSQAPQSMVNQYFSNLNTSGSGLSSNLQTSYNNAKNNISSILGTNQQFGYSAQPYGLLSSTNMAANPFNIPYLQQRGLI
jgi:hypothetical protein